MSTPVNIMTREEIISELQMLRNINYPNKEEKNRIIQLEQMWKHLIHPPSTLNKSEFFNKMESLPLLSGYQGRFRDLVKKQMMEGEADFIEYLKEER